MRKSLHRVAFERRLGSGKSLLIYVVLRNAVYHTRNNVGEVLKLTDNRAKFTKFNLKFLIDWQKIFFNSFKNHLLFGTDAPLGVFGEKALKQSNAYDENIQNIKQAIKDNFGEDANRIISKVFYRNAKKLLTPKLDTVG